MPEALRPGKTYTRLMASLQPSRRLRRRKARRAVWRVIKSDHVEIALILTGLCMVLCLIFLALDLWLRRQLG